MTVEYCADTTQQLQDKLKQKVPNHLTVLLFKIERLNKKFFIKYTYCILQVDSDLADQINFSSELDIFHSGK